MIEIFYFPILPVYSFPFFLESTSLDDDWEKDFDDDIEVTEEDMKLAAEAAKKLAESRATVDDGDVSVK